MDKVELLKQIFEVCIIPLLAILTSYAIAFVKAKKNEILNNIEIDNEENEFYMLKKYIDMASETVIKCIKATNQTYVDSLKASNSFDLDAQKEAFQKTLDAVIASLSAEAKTYLTEAFGDIETYIGIIIESKIKSFKNM